MPLYQLFLVSNQSLDFSPTMSKAGRHILLILAAFLIYRLFFAPSPLDDRPPVAFNPPPLPDMPEINHRLQDVDVHFRHQIKGPESMVVDGESIITGLTDGRIVRLYPGSGKMELVLRTGPSLLGEAFKFNESLCEMDKPPEEMRGSA